MIDLVSETYKCDWDRACHMNVFEFLNVYSYAIAKLQTEQAMIKASYDKIKSKYKH